MHVLPSARILFIAILSCFLCFSHDWSLAGDDCQPPETRQTPQVLLGHHHQLTYLSQVQIPAFEIGGVHARIHTQGIYVTENSIYVSGRWERNPKRAMFFRFQREDLAQMEYLDITPVPDAKQNIAAGLDHPGGFDYDGNAFWIPVAVSKPHSATIMLKINTALDAPLTEAMTEAAFVLRDHVGALAIDPTNQRLFGANWDTRVIYTWNTDGAELARVSQEKLIHDNPHWALAVQDWKYVSGTTLLAGGLDKAPKRDRSQPRAVLDWVDIEQRKLLDRIHIVDPDGRGQNLTHEGMALFRNELFFLPRDLGKDAILYRYRVESISPIER